LYRAIFRDPDFLAGRIHTDYLDHLLATGWRSFSRDDTADLQLLRDLACIAATVHAATATPSTTPAPTDSPSLWKTQGRLALQRSRL
jgi:hypothetical protein